MSDDARRALGARLRELRKQAGLTGTALAHEAGWAQSKVPKIENGRQLPSDSDLRAWCRITDADLALPDLIATAANIHAAYLEWKRITDTGHARRQRASIEHESGTRLIRGYGPLIPSGLLQTRAYAEIILRRCIDFVGSPDDLSEALEARMQRQKILTEGAHQFHYLIGEPALYTGVGDDAVRLDQLRHLLELMELSRLVVGIVPAGAEFVYTTTNFVIHDRRTVLVETIAAELTITQPRELAYYEKAWTALQTQAIYGDRARATIARAMNRS